jgi:hypothetical protein
VLDRLPNFFFVLDEFSPPPLRVQRSAFVHWANATGSTENAQPLAVYGLPSSAMLIPPMRGQSP